MKKNLLLLFALFTCLNLSAQEPPKIGVEWQNSTEINSSALSPDGKYMAFATSDSTVSLWEVGSAKAFRVFSRHRDKVFRVEFSSNGQNLLIGLSNQAFCVVDFESGKVLKEVSKPVSGFSALAISSDGRYVAAGGYEDGQVRLWDMNSGDQPKTLKGHQKMVNGLCFSKDDQFLISGSDDKTVKIWHTLTGKLTETLAAHREMITALAVSPDGKFLFSGSDDSGVKRWEMGNPKNVMDLDGNTRPTSFAFTADGSRTICAGWNGKITVWETSTGKEINRFGQEVYAPHEIYFLDNGKYAAAVTAADVLLWEVGTGKEMADFVLFEGGSSFVALSPDGRFDGTPAMVRKNLYLVQEDDIVPVDAVYKAYYTEGLLEKVMKN